jgi:hypothetical protein
MAPDSELTVKSCEIGQRLEHRGEGGGLLTPLAVDKEQQLVLGYGARVAAVAEWIAACSATEEGIRGGVSRMINSIEWPGVERQAGSRSFSSAVVHNAHASDKVICGGWSLCA